MCKAITKYDLQAAAGFSSDPPNQPHTYNISKETQDFSKFLKILNN